MLFSVGALGAEELGGPNPSSCARAGELRADRVITGPGTEPAMAGHRAIRGCTHHHWAGGCNREFSRAKTRRSRRHGSQASSAARQGCQGWHFTRPARAPQTRVVTGRQVEKGDGSKKEIWILSQKNFTFHIPCAFISRHVPSPLLYKEILLSELRKLDRRGCQSADVFQ